MPIYGGHLKDVPEPHRRYYADRRRRRPVRVRIMKYYGIGLHYHVSIEEEADAVWDSSVNQHSGKPNGWRRCWDDKTPGAKGEFVTFKRRTHLEALAEARRVLLRRFPKRTHSWRLESLCGDEVPRGARWFYKNEGD